MDRPSPPVLLLDRDAVASFVGLPGWRQHAGFDLDLEPWDLSTSQVLCVGIVDDATAPAALEAVARGAGLVACVVAHGAVRHRFLEDLHKLAAPTTEPPAAAALAVSQLTSLQRDLLAALADGATVTGAAASLHLSRRSANRALAEARQVLGAASTADAVRRWSEARPRP